MQFHFLLKDVEITRVDRIKKIESPNYSDDFVQLNDCEFSMTIPEVAEFYVRNGTQVNILPFSNDQKTIELYLNGTILGAILFQRKILAIHGSSFHYQGKTILVGGMSGAGKSTLTSAFIQKGGRFITDDISPIIFKDNKPYIQPISESIKLWGDSIKKLEIDWNKTTPVNNKHDKHFVHQESVSKPLKVDKLLILGYDNNAEFKSRVVRGAEKFQVVLDQVYKKEYVIGIDNWQECHFRELVQFCNSTEILFISRPEKLEFNHFIHEIESIITT